MAGGNHNHDDDDVDPASPWEEAQTEPLPRRRQSSLDSSPGDDDPDRTLPLPSEKEDASKNVERLVKLLAREGTVGEGDAAAVLSHLMRLRNISSGGGSSNNDDGSGGNDGNDGTDNDGSGDNNNDNDNEGGLQWSAANVRLVRAAVQSALRSLHNNNASNNGTNATATTNSHSNSNTNNQLAHKIFCLPSLTIGQDCTSLSPSRRIDDAQTAAEDIPNLHHS